MVEHNFTEAEQHHRHSYAHYRGSSKVHMQASKQASKQANPDLLYVYAGPVCGGFPPHTGPACLRSAHGKKAILRIRHAKSGMVRDTDTYYEYKTPIYKFIAYENNFTRN